MAKETRRRQVVTELPYIRDIEIAIKGYPPILIKLDVEECPNPHSNNPPGSGMTATVSLPDFDEDMLQAYVEPIHVPCKENADLSNPFHD